jgi:parallel beta-helix repeat protein
MNSSIGQVFVKRCVCVVVIALGVIFHVPWVWAEPTPITQCGPITKSGSYVLADNLTATTPSFCLQVNVDFVTIDLAGFLITAPGTGGAGGIGGSARGFTVRNGTVTGFTFGLFLNGPGSIVEGVRALGNSNGGIVSGSASSLRNNIVQENRGFGIVAGANSIVSGNTVHSNEFTGHIGIEAGAGSIVSANTVSGYNSDGIHAGSGSTVSNNIVFGNRGIGILITQSESETEFAGSGSLVSGNTVRGNNQGGIFAGRGSTVSGNIAQGNGPYGTLATEQSPGPIGIEVAPGSSVINNTAEGNSLVLFCGDAGANIIHNTATPAPEGYIIVIGDCTLHENVGQVFRPRGLP